MTKSIDSISYYQNGTVHTDESPKQGTYSGRVVKHLNEKYYRSHKDADCSFGVAFISLGVNTALALVLLNTISGFEMPRSPGFIACSAVAIIAPIVCGVKLILENCNEKKKQF